MRARIFQPAKPATQSGRANTKHWVLEFEPIGRRRHDPLMGWISSGDTRGQVRLAFDTREAALAYAERHGLEAQLQEPKPPTVEPKAYADNFSFKRKTLWTH